MSYEKTKLMNLEDGQTLLGAIDGKMSDLKSALSDNTITKTMASPIPYTGGTAIKSATGEIYSLSGYGITGFIDVQDLVSWTPSRQVDVVCYYTGQSDDTFIPGSGKTGVSGQQTAPEGAKYMIVCGSGGVITTVSIELVYKTFKKMMQDQIDGKASSASVSALSDEVDDISDAVESIIPLMPAETDKLPYVKIENTSNSDLIKMYFTASTGNRVYCGGKNLFDGTISNIALGTSTVMTGSSYRGFICPIKGGLKYTISRSAKSSGRFRFGATVDYPANGVSCVGQAVPADDSLSYTYDLTNHPEAKWLVVYLSNSSEDVSSTNFWVVEGSSAGTYEAYNGTLTTTNDSSLIKKAVNGMTCCWCDSGNIKAGKIVSVEEYVDNAIQGADKKISSSNTGNFSIVCAKEHSYADGSQPIVEYYLIEECTTNKFYMTKDFAQKSYLFTFEGNSRNYAFGVLANGDVIACVLADALASGKDDSHRQNPYCWLASEGWSIQHEVDFGENMKPCGWLSNCGFKVMANGNAMFVEYTRMTVATANVWKISGSPATASNWTVLKSFTITTSDNMTGFKHIHMIVQDQYTGVIYFSTGDDDDNAMIWYSTDNGANWTQLGTASQKYCRNLMFTFTEDYIYWAPDTTADNARYLFRAERDANGVMNFSSKEDYVHIGGDGHIAAYGQSYIPELNAIFVLDRSDGLTDEIPVKLIDLTAGELHTIGTLESPSGTQLVGFRTRYSEWYPKNGLIHIGFGFKTVADFNCVNHIKGFGNEGLNSTGDGANNVNNLTVQVYQNDNGFGFELGTIY